MSPIFKPTYQVRDSVYRSDYGVYKHVPHGMRGRIVGLSDKDGLGYLYTVEFENGYCLTLRGHGIRPVISICSECGADIWCKVDYLCRECRSLL